MAGLGERRHAVAVDFLILDGQDAGRGPLAVRAELDLAGGGIV
jgi:hypothetical protein